MNRTEKQRYERIRRVVMEDRANPTTAPYTNVLRRFAPGAQAGSVVKLCQPPKCGDKVVVKTMIQRDDNDKNDAVVVEAKTAERLAHVVLDGKTPNLAVMYGYRKTLLPKGGRVKGRKPAKYQLFFEACGGDLEAWMSKPHTEKEWFGMLFQVMHGLSEMHRLQIMHGDLHDKNILVCPTSERTLHYRVGGKYYSIPTGGNIFKVYDYGNAYQKGKPARQALYKIGRSRNVRKAVHHNKFRPDMDMIKLFHFMYLENPYLRKVPKKVQEFMKSVITNNGLDHWANRQLRRGVGGSEPRSFSWGFRSRKPPASGIINPRAGNVEALVKEVGDKYFRATRVPARSFGGARRRTATPRTTRSRRHVRSRSRTSRIRAGKKVSPPKRRKTPRRVSRKKKVVSGKKKVTPRRRRR